MPSNRRRALSEALSRVAAYSDRSVAISCITFCGMGRSDTRGSGSDTVMVGKVQSSKKPDCAHLFMTYSSLFCHSKRDLLIPVIISGSRFEISRTLWAINRVFAGRVGEYRICKAPTYNSSEDGAFRLSQPLISRRRVVQYGSALVPMLASLTSSSRGFCCCWFSATKWPNFACIFRRNDEPL